MIKAKCGEFRFLCFEFAFEFLSLHVNTNETLPAVQDVDRYYEISSSSSTIDNQECPESEAEGIGQHLTRVDEFWLSFPNTKTI